MCEIKYLAKNSTPETSEGTSSVFQMTTVTLRFGTCFNFNKRREKKYKAMLFKGNILLQCNLLINIVTKG